MRSSNADSPYINVAPPPPSDKPKDDVDIIVFLSLYLLLVAFFILLNSMATISEEKTKEVIESVKESFRPIESGERTGAEFTSDIGEFAQAETTLIQLADLAKRLFPLVELEMINPGRTLSAAIPVDTLFIGNTTRLTQQADTFIQRVAHLIKSPPGRLRYEVSIVFGRDGAPSLSSKTQELAIKRAGRLARVLIANDGPAHSTLIGSERNLGDMVNFRFDVRELRDGRITFDSHAQ